MNNYRNAKQSGNPEYALKRAQELLAMNKTHQALNELRTIAGRKQKLWHKSLELLVITYAELCVDLGKGKRIRDALYNFKNVCAQQHSPSLETVLRRLIAKVEGKVEDILKAIEEKEGITEGSEEYKKLLDREDVSPWIKFLWEVYKIVLDTLKNHTILEEVYKDTTESAFTYCLKYSRNAEFKKLSNLLKNHFQALTKSGNEVFSQISSITFQLNIRYNQLRTASKLSLWKDAYSVTDDIRSFFRLSTVEIPKDMILSYYEMLSLLFWKSGDYLFHARSLLNLLELKRTENISDEDEKLLATQALLASLSIFQSDDSKQDAFRVSRDIQKDKEEELSKLFLEEVSLSRKDVVNDLVSMGVLETVYDEIRDLYYNLEEKFEPLEAGAALKVGIDFIQKNPKLESYKDLILNYGFCKALQQYSVIYSNMKIENLHKQFNYLSIIEMEKIIVQAIHKGFINCRIDYRKNVINFIPSLNSENMRYNLAHIHQNFQKLLKALYPESKTEKLEKQKKIIQAISGNIDSEREKILERRKLIEKIKEYREEEEKIQKEIETKKEKYRAEESKRLEKERLQKITEDNNKVLAQKQAKQQNIQKTKEFIDILKTKNIETKVNIDKKIDGEEDVVNKILKQMVQEKRRQAKQIKTLSSKMDHQVRAQRELEIPYIKEAWEKKSQSDKELFNRQKEEFETNHLKHWTESVRVKKMLEKMEYGISGFENVVAEKLENSRKEAEEERNKQIQEYLKERLPKYEEEQKLLLEAKKKKEEEERIQREKEEELRKQKKVAEPSKPWGKVANPSNVAPDWKKQSTSTNEEFEESQRPEVNMPWVKRQVEPEPKKEVKKFDENPNTAKPWGKNTPPSTQTEDKETSKPWRRNTEGTSTTRPSTDEKKPWSKNTPPQTEEKENPNTAKPWGKNPIPRTTGTTTTRPSTEEKKPWSKNPSPQTDDKETSKPWTRNTQGGTTTTRPSTEEKKPWSKNTPPTSQTEDNTTRKPWGKNTTTTSTQTEEKKDSKPWSRNTQGGTTTTQSKPGTTQNRPWKKNE